MASFEDLRPRLVAAGVLGGLGLAFLAWGGLAFAGFVAAGVFLMLQELVDIVRRDIDMRRAVAVGFAGCGAVAVLISDVHIFAGLVVGVLGIAVAFLAQTARPGAIPIAGYVLIVAAGVAVVQLRLQPNGFWLLSWVILCVIAADVGGYVFGRRLGGPKFWPRLSPKKTWAGVLGGLCLSLGVALIYCLASSGSVIAFLFFGALIAIVSVGGDLLESALKRHFGVKDAGTILPGHGGLLDRFDGMSAVMVVFLAISQMIDLPGTLGGYEPPAGVGGGL